MSLQNIDKEALITQEYLKSILEYNPETGDFTWKIKTKNGKKHIGDIAGYLDKKGYISIQINGIGYLAHRLAWFYMTGNWPIHEIDHKNRIRNNNRIENLRDVTRTINGHNQGMFITNTTGFKGVYLCKNGKYRAGISLNDKIMWLGTFFTPEEASVAYESAKLFYHNIQE